MNTDTYEIARMDALKAADLDKWMPLSEKEAATLLPMNRAQRREWLRKQRRRKS
jgi:hypothetical protein